MSVMTMAELKVEKKVVKMAGLLVQLMAEMKAVLMGLMLVELTVEMKAMKKVVLSVP